jgi:hypothetical protein
LRGGNTLVFLIGQIMADQYRATTERLKVLTDFVARPVHAFGGTEPDPDIISAYNLAVEAALIAIRREAEALGEELK